MLMPALIDSIKPVQHRIHKHTIVPGRDHWYQLTLISIMLVAIAVRVYNLNYNSPFADEAIYIVLGKLGLFHWDWWSYNAPAWMGGSLFAYPPLAALAYTTGGIVGARLLNVAFGLGTIMVVSAISGLLVPKNAQAYAKLIAAFIMTVSAVAIYTSRLATYDAPSFFFLFLSILLFLKAEQPRQHPGQMYFFSAMSLLIAVFIKIISIIYLPLLIALTGIRAYRLSKQKHRFYWKRYYLAPLLVMGLLLALILEPVVRIYLPNQRLREIATYKDIILLTLTYSLSLIIVWFISLLTVLKTKLLTPFLILTAAALYPLLIHLTTNRLSTLDKHLFLTHAFLAIACAIGLASGLVQAKQKTRRIAQAIIIFSLLLLAINSIKTSQRFNLLWPNTSKALDYLSLEIQPGDRVLSQTGPPVLLSTFNRNHPTNTTTFDWFEYRRVDQISAYAAAVGDGYFDYIEILTDSSHVTLRQQQINQSVINNLDNAYTLVYDQDSQQIYKRVY